MIVLRRIYDYLVETAQESLIYFSLLLVLFVTNAFHEKYPDEFDSIVGGRYITEGKLPYRDWFQHHQPGAYVMAAGVLSFAGQSFVKFRIGWEIALYALLVGSYLLLSRRLPKEKFVLLCSAFVRHWAFRARIFGEICCLRTR